MKVTQHVEHLLRQGRNPKELVELGFPKLVVTKVRRQLKGEKSSQLAKAVKGRAGAKVESRPQPSALSPEMIALMEHRLTSFEGKFQGLETRVEVLEAADAEFSLLEDIEERLGGTPALGLKHRFKCSCGASGFVALHIMCTKCEKATWWGWFPKQ